MAIALNDTDPEVRLAAIREVAGDPNRTLDEPALDALIECVGANRKVIQRRAAEALAGLALRDARVIGKLRAMLSHPNRAPDGARRMRWA